MTTFTVSREFYHHTISISTIPIVATPLLLEMCKKNSHWRAAAIVDEKTGRNEHDRTSVTEIYVSQPFQKNIYKIADAFFFFRSFSAFSLRVFFFYFHIFWRFSSVMQMKNFPPFTDWECPVPSFVHAPLSAMFSSTRNVEQKRVDIELHCVLWIMWKITSFTSSALRCSSIFHLCQTLFIPWEENLHRKPFQIEFMYRSHRFFQSFFFSFSLNKLSRSSAKYIQNFI